MRRLIALVFALLPFIALASKAFASGHEIAPRVLAPAPYALRYISTAFAGERFLSVFLFDTGAGDAHIVGIFSDADGKRISPQWFPIVDVDSTNWLQLVGTGDSYALFWRAQTLNSAVQMAAIDLNGVVTSQRTVEIPSTIDMTVAWNGTHFIGVIRHPLSGLDRTDAFVFDREGRRLQTIPIEGFVYSREAAPVPNGFVVLTSSGRGVFADRVSMAQSHATHLEVERNWTVPFAGSVVAGRNEAGDVLALWSSGGTALRSALIRAGGEVTTPIQTAVLANEALPLHVTATAAGFRIFFTTRTEAASPRTLWTQQLDRNGAALAAPESVASLHPLFFPPEAASNDRTTLILVPTEGYNTLNSHATTIAVAHDGRASAPEVVSIAPVRQSDPVVVRMNDRVLAIWSESSADAAETRMRELTPAAEPLSAPSVVAANAPLGTIAVASNGSELLIAGAQGDKLVVDGRIAGDIDNGRRPAVAWSIDRWVVVWTREQKIMLATVSPSGTISQPRELNIGTSMGPGVPGGGYRWFQNIALAFDGRELLLVWNETRTTSCLNIPCQTTPLLLFAARLDINGTPIDRNATLLATAKPMDAIAASERELMILSWGSVIPVQIEGGVFHALEPRALVDYPWGIAGDIAWDGADFVVALRYGVFRSHLSLHRLAPNGIEVVQPLHAYVSPADFDRIARPSIASQHGESALIAFHENAPADTARVVAHVEHEMQPRISAPPAPASAHYTPLPSYAAVVWWDDVAGEVDGYSIETRIAGGTYTVAAVVAPGTESVTLPVVYGSVRVRAFNAGGVSPATEAHPPDRRRSARH